MYVGELGFEAHLERKGQRTVVQLDGELDLATAPVLARSLNDWLAHAGSEVALDLSRLRFVDVAGARALARAADLARAAGREVVVVSPAPLVARVIRLVGLLEEARIDSRVPGQVL